MLRFKNIGVTIQLVKMRNNVAILIWFARYPEGSPKIPLSIPAETMINATPITGIIPSPILNASLRLNPAIRAPNALPRKFENIESVTNAAQNTRIGTS